MLISVRDTDKQEMIPIADRFSRMGFELYGTSGTANVLNHNMIATNLVRKNLRWRAKYHYIIGEWKDSLYDLHLGKRQNASKRQRKNATEVGGTLHLLPDCH